MVFYYGIAILILDLEGNTGHAMDETGLGSHKELTKIDFILKYKIYSSLWF